MSKEIDVRVAEVMGYCAEDVQGEGWAFSKNIAASRAMEDWIEEQGLRQRLAYVDHLCQIIGYCYQWTNDHLLWATVRATPEQRCLAFLAAMGK